jgi:hypothetical protein
MEQRAMSACQPQTNRVHTVLTGVMLVLSGVVLLGAMRDWRIVERYWAFWPLMLLLPATGRFFGQNRSLVAGTAWAGVAALLVSVNLGYVHVRVQDLLPLLLVAFGIRLLLRSRARAGKTR